MYGRACLSSHIDQPPRSHAVPAAASEPWSSTGYSAILSFLGPFVTPRETSSNMVLGVEVDGIAEYPVEDQGSEAAAGTASDLGGWSTSEDTRSPIHSMTNS